MTTGYVYPVQGLGLGRTDQGVDFTGKGTIAALGDAVIERVSPQGSRTGWPGAAGSTTGAMIVYRLLHGARAGQHVYVAENIDPAAGLRVGQTVKAGQPIATARGTAPFIETGFSDAAGTPVGHAGYHEGQATAAGKEFLGFLKGLPGANVHGAPLDAPANALLNAVPGLKVPGQVGQFVETAPEKAVDALAGAFASVFPKAFVYFALVVGGAALVGIGVARAVGVSPANVAKTLAKTVAL